MRSMSMLWLATGVASVAMGEIELHVTDAKSGSGIRYALVCLDMPRPDWVVTDPDGGVRVTGLPEDSLRIRIEALGFAPETLVMRPGLRGAQRATVRLVPRPETRETLSCDAGPAARPPAAPQGLPSITLPAPLDRVLRDYERAWRAGDADALVALFTEDGFVLQPGRPPTRGREALAAVYRGQGGGPLKLRALAYAAADSIGYIIGAYGYGDAPDDVGKFTLTLRRDRGGRWLIASDMDNGSQPPRRPGAQGPPS